MRFRLIPRYGILARLQSPFIAADYRIHKGPTATFDGSSLRARSLRLVTDILTPQVFPPTSKTSLIAMSQPRKYQYMDTSKQTALYGPKTSKVSASYYTTQRDDVMRTGDLPKSSGLSADWGAQAKGDSDDEDEGGDDAEEERSEEEESSEVEESSEEEDSSDDAEEGQKGPAAANPEEEHSEAESDQAVDSDQEAEDEGVAESADESEEDGSESILRDSARIGFRKHNRKVGFGSIIQKTEQEATKDCKGSFRTGTDGTERRKTWKRLDPDAREPPEVSEGTEVVTGRSGRGSVAVLDDGRKGFVKKKRS